jgi:hypothetical protein
MMKKRSEHMALPKNRAAVKAIYDLITPRILGQELPASGCSCGCISHGPAVAVKVIPDGDSMPGYEVQPWWSVRMAQHPEKPTRGQQGIYYVDINCFIPRSELEVLFEHHFGKNPKITHDYKLPIAGESRWKAGLNVAVSIRDNEELLTFDFDWGREQAIAKKLGEIADTAPKRILAGSEPFQQVLKLLSKLNPDVYAGGPEPELPFESYWLTNYQEALQRAQAKDVHHMLVGIGRTHMQHYTISGSGTVTFLKNW